MNEHYPFVNPPLPYAYNALEPYIDEKTMHLHHDRHLQTYVDNLNKALSDYPELQSLALTQLLENDRLPEAVKNNAGGVFNHLFYFDGMSNSRRRSEAGELYSVIINNFESLDSFYNTFKNRALSVFGSGYAWLVLDKKGGLKIISTANQDTPLAQNLCPIAVVDVWEHAYYLKHYNERAAYFDDWFNVVDWDHANRLHQQCVEGK